MKIEYENDGFINHNEACGSQVYRKRLEKNKNKKIHTYTYYWINNILISFILIVLLEILNVSCQNRILNPLLNYIITVLVFLIIFGIFAMTLYLFFKKLNKKGTLIIDEEGLLDKSATGMTLGMTWDKIKIMVITNNTITFVSNNSFLFYLNINKLKEVEKSLKKYNKELPIIDKRTNA